MSTLEDLPPETLRHICEYVPPQGLAFSSKGIGGSWDLYVQEENGPRIKVVRNLTHANTINNPQCKHCFGQKPCGCQYTILDEIHTALLHVNKRIAAEARGMYKPTHSVRSTLLTKSSCILPRQRFQAYDRLHCLPTGVTRVLAHIWTTRAPPSLTSSSRPQTD